MNRIVRLILPAVAAFVFFLIACGNENEPPQINPPENGQTDSSSSISGEPSQPPEQGQRSSSSASITGGDTDSSSSAGSSSSDTQNAQSSSGTSSVSQSSSSSIAPSVPNPKADFTETVGNVSFNMIYIPGGTFTIGCEKSSGCPADANPVSGVKVSNYYISKTEVTNALWKAVMGSEVPPPQYAQNSGSATHMDWFQAIEFTCKLSNMTGRKYHMTTEAEWEYAAKNHLSKLSNIGSGEEWAYNTWSSTHSGGTDPIGPIPDVGLDGHPILTTQKTRRDAQGTADNITGRLIRSIDGIGPALRLAISDEMAYPPNMVPACDIHAPVLGDEPANSYRDPRWVTGDNAKWGPGAGTTVGSLDLKVWADGTAQFGTTNGQWFTSNNITFVFVPTSGSIKRFAYIFLSETEGALIPTENLGYNTGYVGKIAKKAATNTKPPVSGLKSGEDLAKAQSNFATDYKMVDMTNMPTGTQDSRLLDEDTPDAARKGWFQDNTSAGGVHHYRKDVDPSEFRFTVNNPGTNGAYSRVFLANGSWFTVNNTFLRVKHKDGYVAEYLYTVTPDGTFYHNSFMAYERADFRMFKKETNASWPNTTCGSFCAEEIPKGQAQSLYASQGDKGKSTFKPAPCPAGGCQ